MSDWLEVHTTREAYSILLDTCVAAERERDELRNTLAKVEEGFWTLRKGIGDFTIRASVHNRDDHNQGGHCSICNAMDATRELAAILRQKGK